MLKKIDYADNMNDQINDQQWISAFKNLGIFLVFASSHIVLARPWYKQIAQKYFYSFKFERSVYVGVAALCLHSLIHFWSPMPIIYQVKNPLLNLILGKIIPSIGFILLMAASFQIDHFEMFGLKQSMEMEIPKFVFGLYGFYKVVRHPIMTGFLILVNINRVISYGRLLLALMIDLFIVVGVFKFEEPLLVQEFGKKYSNYQKNVSAFFPVGKKSRKSD